MAHMDFLILLSVLCNIVWAKYCHQIAKGKLLMKNILNVHSQINNYFLIREIKVSKFRMLIRFCYDFPAPSTLFVMAYNNCFNFLFFIGNSA